MKGIILAGGSGSRLYPLTKYVSKQLLPIYDKPMIYYPLSTLMQGGIRDILIISDSANINSYKKLFSDGSQFGINLSYCTQEKPNGIAEAFILGEKFIDDSNVALILGDNIFHGENLRKLIKSSITKTNNGQCVIVGHKVPDPERYGVAVLEKNKVIHTNFSFKKNTEIIKDEIEVKFDDFGLFLKTVGVTDDFLNGKGILKLKLKKNTQSVLSGSYNIDNFSIKNASFLTRILQLASFTGLLEILGNDGIPFQKLSGNFDKKNNLIEKLSIL